MSDEQQPVGLGENKFHGNGGWTAVSEEGFEEHLAEADPEVKLTLYPGKTYIDPDGFPVYIEGSEFTQLGSITLHIYAGYYLGVTIARIQAQEKYQPSGGFLYYTEDGYPITGWNSRTGHVVFPRLVKEVPGDPSTTV